MRIVLILPQSERYRYRGSFLRSLRYAPLTLTTLAALIPEELSAEVEIIDEGVQELDLDRLHADLVGISVITPTAHRAYGIASRLRERGIPVVLGGVHPTLVPEEAERHADAVVLGYAEETWPRLLRDFAAGHLQKRYTQDKEYQLNSVPEPRRELLPKRAYITSNTVQAVRGCPLRCSFCVVPVAWPRYLHRPVVEVIAEIEKLPGKTFLFLDLSPIEDVAYAKKLYRELIPLRKKWGGLATLRITEDDELLDLAAKSGCSGLLIGFESVSAKAIASIGKRINKPHDYQDRVRKLHDHGIAVNGCFVLGIDGDDESCFDRTVEFVQRAAIDLPRFSVPTPFPGTPLYHDLQQQGRILTHDWRLYDTQTVVIRPTEMSPERLQQGLIDVWRNTYSIPSTMRRLWGSAATLNPTVAKSSILANLGYRFYSRFLPKSVPMACELEPWNYEPELIGVTS